MYTQLLQKLLQELNNEERVKNLLKIKLNQGEVTDVEYKETVSEKV